MNKWVNAQRDTDVVPAEDRELAREPPPEGGEDILKSHPVLREPKAVRFRSVEKQSGAFPINRLCRVMNVSPRGLRAFSVGLEKPGRFRTEGGLNEHLERHKYATGPLRTTPARRMLGSVRKWQEVVGVALTL